MMGAFMKYAIEMGSGAMVYILKTGSGIGKLKGHGDRISPLSFFQNKESRLKMMTCGHYISVHICFRRERLS
jgi:hypothetical protein